MLQLCNVQKWGKTKRPFWLFHFQTEDIAIHEEMFVDKTQAFFDKFSQMIPFYLWCHFLMWYYFAWWSLGFQFATIGFVLRSKMFVFTIQRPLKKYCHLLRTINMIVALELFAHSIIQYSIKGEFKMFFIFQIYILWNDLTIQKYSRSLTPSTIP